MSSFVIAEWVRCASVETQLRQVVDALIAEASKESSPEASRWLLRNPGKNIRATLLLLSARFGEERFQDLVPLAVGVELLHTATLYHDDIIDRALIRRGILAPAQIWGERAAIYAGCYILSRSIELFSTGGTPVLQLVTGAIERLWRGEMEELANLGNIWMPIGRHLATVLKKTGTLFELPCRLGVQLSGASPSRITALARFGRKLGIAFQLIDDLYDLLGNNPTEKEQGVDLRMGVCSLPLLHCFRNSPEAALLTHILCDNNSTVEPGEVRAILQRSGSFQFAKALIDLYLQKAQAILGELPRIEARDSLFGLIYSLRASVNSFA